MTTPETPVTQPATAQEPKPDYDMSIHTNPDARAWADFFMQNWIKMCENGQNPFHPEEDYAKTEKWMGTWFANAMMAMHDHAQRVTSAALADARKELAAMTAERDSYQMRAEAHDPLFQLTVDEMWRHKADRDSLAQRLAKVGPALEGIIQRDKEQYLRLASYEHLPDVDEDWMRCHEDAKTALAAIDAARAQGATAQPETGV